MGGVQPVATHKDGRYYIGCNLGEHNYIRQKLAMYQLKTK